MYVCVCIWLNRCMKMRHSENRYIYIHACMHINTHTMQRRYSIMHTCMNTYIHINMYAYIHTQYINIYTHTHRRQSIASVLSSKATPSQPKSQPRAPAAVIDQSVCMYVYVCVCVYIYIYLQVRVYIYVRMCDQCVYVCDQCVYNSFTAQVSTTRSSSSY